MAGNTAQNKLHCDLRPKRRLLMYTFMQHSDQHVWWVNKQSISHDN